MLQKLSKNKYQILIRIPDLFKFPLVGAVMEKKQYGIVYVDNNINPQIVFIIHKAGFSYLYNNVARIDYEQLINFLISEKDIPVYFHLYDPPKELINYSLGNEKLGVKVRNRIQLRYNRKDIDVERYRPEGPVIAKNIDKENFDSLDIFDLQLSNKFWSSREDFLKEGYGFFLTNEENYPIAMCYSTCISNNLAEVDIITRQEYQRLGLAKYAAALFIAKGLKKNIITNWDCFEENKGSLKTANKLGFEEIKKYSFLSLYNYKK